MGRGLAILLVVALLSGCSGDPTQPAEPLTPPQAETSPSTEHVSTARGTGDGVDTIAASSLGADVLLFGDFGIRIVRQQERANVFDEPVVEAVGDTLGGVVFEPLGDGETPPGIYRISPDGEVNPLVLKTDADLDLSLLGVVVWRGRPHVVFTRQTGVPESIHDDRDLLFLVAAPVDEPGEEVVLVADSGWEIGWGPVAADGDRILATMCYADCDVVDVTNREVKSVGMSTGPIVGMDVLEARDELAVLVDSRSIEETPRLLLVPLRNLDQQPREVELPAGDDLWSFSSYVSNVDATTFLVSSAPQFTDQRVTFMVSTDVGESAVVRGRLDEPGTGRFLFPTEEQQRAERE